MNNPNVSTFSTAFRCGKSQCAGLTRIAGTVVLTVLLLLIVQSAFAQTTIYFDDFSGDAFTDLHGTTPDVTDSFGGATSGATWLAGGNMNSDGVVGGLFDLDPVVTHFGRSVALLPFQPQYGYKYVLSASFVGDDTTNINWMAIGFTRDANADWLADPAQSAANWVSPGFNPVFWALSRMGSACPYSDQAFVGPVVAGGLNSTTTNTDAIRVTLDTTSLTNWVVAWSFRTNGTPDGFVSYTNSNIDLDYSIQYVGFGSSGDDVGQAIDNFTLTAEQVITTNVAPIILEEPVGFTNYIGDSPSLSAVVVGTSPVSYQWYKDDLPLAGETDFTLEFASLDFSDEGTYYLTADNVAGSVTSSVVSVAVVGTNIISPQLLVRPLPKTDTDVATGIDSSKHYLCALDFGSTTTPVAVNGVDFMQVYDGYTGPALGRYWSAPLAVGVDTNYGGSFVMEASRIYGVTSPSLGLGAGSNTGFTTQADGQVGELLRDVAALSGNSLYSNTVFTLTFGKLTPGNTYSLHNYFRDWSGDYRPIRFTFNGQGTNESYEMDENVGGAFSMEYTFIAATNTVAMTLTELGYNLSPLIYAVTLEAATAEPNAAPTMVLQPRGFTNWDTSLPFVNYTMVALAGGTQPITYQWYKDGASFGSTTNVLSLTNSDAGNYQVVAANAYGSVTSSVAPYVVAGEADTVTISPSFSLVGLPASGTDAASGISSTNTYLCALDFSAATTSDALSINGVSFQQVILTNGGGSAVHPVMTGVDPTYGGSWQFTYTNSSPGGTQGFLPVAGGGTALQADGSSLSMLTDMCYPHNPNSGNGDPCVGVFSGLTPGASYSLRYYYREWNPVGNGRVITFIFNGQGYDESCAVDLDAGGARYLKYDFVAASTNVVMTMRNFVAAGPHLYGLTLQQTAAAPVSVLLQYSISGRDLTLFWDAGITGYTLESADALPGTSWTPVNGVLNNSVTVDASNGTRFYRLHKQ